MNTNWGIVNQQNFTWCQQHAYLGNLLKTCFDVCKVELWFGKWLVMVTWNSSIPHSFATTSNIPIKKN